MVYYRDAEPRSFPNLSALSKRNNTINYKVYPRVFLQFNQLVFEGMDTVLNSSSTGDYKTEFKDYTFENGAYFNQGIDCNHLLTGVQDLNLTIMLPFKRLTGLQVASYHEYIQTNLSRVGKLWAVDTGGVLIWAWAVPNHPPHSDYILTNSKSLTIPMSFTLPEGFWHRADTENIYLEPYEMSEFATIDFHANYSYMSRGAVEHDTCSCGSLDVRWKYNNTVYNPYERCNNPFRIIEKCEAKRNPSGWEFQELDCVGINGTYEARTVYPAPTQVTLLGRFTNPSVTIQDTNIRLKGSYYGKLEFKKGEVIYSKFEPDRSLMHGNPISLTNIDFTNSRLLFHSDSGSNDLRVSYSNTDGVHNKAWVYVDELVI